MPIEPGPCLWDLPDPSRARPGEDLVGIGADLAPGTLIEAYRSGIFPMHVSTSRGEKLGWWSPDPRAILPLDGMRVTRSLRKSAGRFTVTADECFERVMRACARPEAPDRWITPEFISAYCELHRLGWAHSIEVWDRSGALVGGLYGVHIGGFFAGESMFHRVADASKVAMLGLVDVLRGPEPDAATAHRILDVQWRTEHLGSLGAVEVRRAEYLRRLPSALVLPAVAWPRQIHLQTPRG